MTNVSEEKIALTIRYGKRTVLVSYVAYFNDGYNIGAIFAKLDKINKKSLNYLQKTLCKKFNCEDLAIINVLELEE